MYNANVLDRHYEYEVIDSHLKFVSFHSIIIEGGIDEVQYPFINVKPTLKANIVENKRYTESCDFEINKKKNYPVRKINKKLRKFSGLEIPINDKNVKYASLIDMNLNEIPFRFQCCSQFAEVISNLEACESKCQVFIPECLYSVIKTQNFTSVDDLPVSDNDDVESLDAPLVIVEIEDLPFHEKSIIKGKNGLDNKTNNQEIISRFDDQSVANTDESCITKLNLPETPKSYSFRQKSRQSISFRNGKKHSKDFISHKIRRPLFSRACKITEYNQKTSISKTYDNSDLIKRINLKTPVCSIEKLSHNEIIANLYISHSPIIENEVFNVCDSSLNLHDKANIVDKNTVNINEPVMKNFNIKILKKLRTKVFEKIKTRNKFNIYKGLKRSIWRKTISRVYNYKSKSKRKIISKYSHDYSDNLSSIDNNVKLIEEGIAQIIIQSKNYNEDICDNYDNISINVENDSPSNQFNSYLDSNNVETFSRNYGSFSLKIKVQKKDPSVIEKPIEISKKHKKNSRKRKKLRHFLSSIIGPEDTTFNKFNCSEFNVTCNNLTEPNTDKKRKNRKRKYTVNRDDVYCLRNNGNNQRPPQLTPESIANEELQYQKPIKIKLFKSTSDDLMKSDGSSFHSEKVIFSLQKSESVDKKESNKASNQNIVQISQELSSKPCRQAANLAKKKIFSTAKEDRRSQNATLTSIWNSKKSNNGTVKTSSDILTIYQSDRGKRPRGRPPKLNQSLFISEKQASSTGTLKLKIKLSKDFKNCNNDSHSSNGENSGRTSTNDSSILNSAVAGINGPSDALSLESNNFINGITEQLDQNIEYLEAKEAKVYFDPNQVDIERIKNSYYSSKKTNSESFSFESQQRLYEDSISDICSKKSEIVSGHRNFSQYNDLDTVETNNLYTNILSKENLNSKISHLPKENISIIDNCYKNVANREPQNQSQTNQSFLFENQLPSSGKNPPDLWQNSKTDSTTLTSCRNNSSWFSDPRNMRDPSFPNSNSILYNSYITSTSKENKSCISQNPPFVVCENETTDSKLPQRSPSKRSSSTEGRKSGSNSFSLNESHNQLSPHYVRGSVPTQLNIHPWSDEPNHNTSLNHTAAAWMTYAQQQAAAAAYMDPQMKAYYNLALSQSMLNNPYCGSYGNPAANSENFYSSLHSQCLNNSKDANEKIGIANGGVRSHSDPMGSFMEAAQMSSWEHFYSAAAMAGYHNSSHGTMDDYAGRAGNMLQAHHMLANGYPGSMLGRDHFSLDSNKPPLAHQNQSGTTSPIKLTVSGSTPVSSSQAYSHVQMPYSHFSGTTVGFF